MTATTPNNDPQEPTPPTGQLKVPHGQSAGDLIDQHVKDNYAQLNDEGRPYSQLADEAERMGDRVLTEYLRGEKDSDAHREKVKRDRDDLAAAERQRAAERGEVTPDAAPKGRAQVGKSNG